MIYYIRRKFKQIKNIIKWIPILWNQFDFDYSYSIDVFKFQLQQLSNHLKSNDSNTASAKQHHLRLEIIIKLMTKVYDDDYRLEYLELMKSIYGEDLMKSSFVNSENTIKDDKYPGMYVMTRGYEITESKEKIKEIENRNTELQGISQRKQKRAHKLLWELIEHNIQNMRD